MTTQNNRLQNRVAGSEYTLPVCVAIATLLWCFPWQGASLRLLVGWLLAAAGMAAVLLTNEEFHLTRIRTRLMASAWLLLTAAMPFAHESGKPILCAVCLTMAHPLLFRCYQNPQPYFSVFGSFLFLGIGAMYSAVMWLMAVMFCIYMCCALRALSWRSFFAALLGFVTPMWLLLGWDVVTDDIGGFVRHFTALEEPQPPSLEAYAAVPLPCMLLCAFMCVLGAVSIIHYMRHNYSDKIRIRMVMYIYIMQSIVLLVTVMLQPATYRTAMAMTASCAGPLIAHYFALKGSRGSNILFAVSLAVYIILAYLNIWMPSLSF